MNLKNVKLQNVFIFIISVFIIFNIDFIQCQTRIKPVSKLKQICTLLCFNKIAHHIRKVETEEVREKKLYFFRNFFSF